MGRNSNSGGFGASISAHPYLSMSHLKHEGSDFLKDKYLPKAFRSFMYCNAYCNAHSDEANAPSASVSLSNSNRCMI